MSASPEQPWTLPEIDRERCTGCGNCEELCPTKAVAVVEGIAVIIHPEACTFCDRCERYCPEEAISRPFIIRFASQLPVASSQ
jgi:ferredoxin